MGLSVSRFEQCRRSQSGIASRRTATEGRHIALYLVYCRICRPYQTKSGASSGQWCLALRGAVRHTHVPRPTSLVHQTERKPPIQFSICMIPKASKSHAALSLRNGSGNPASSLLTWCGGTRSRIPKVAINVRITVPRWNTGHRTLADPFQSIRANISTPSHFHLTFNIFAVRIVPAGRQGKNM